LKKGKLRPGAQFKLGGEGGESIWVLLSAGKRKAEEEGHCKSNRAHAANWHEIHSTKESVGEKGVTHGEKGDLQKSWLFFGKKGRVTKSAAVMGTRFSKVKEEEGGPGGPEKGGVNLGMQFQ